MNQGKNPGKMAKADSNVKTNLLCILLAFAVVAIDQLTKYLVRLYIEPGQSISVLGSILHLTYRTNTGAGFSILEGQQILLISIAIMAVIISAVYAVKSADVKLKALLSLFAGAVLGNLIDRLFFGFVTDFIDFRIWPVFNISDSMLTITVILLIIYSWKKEK
jgi:signal peptidase II